MLAGSQQYPDKSGLRFAQRALLRISLEFDIANSSKNFTFVSPFFHVKSVCAIFTVGYIYYLSHLERAMGVFGEYATKLILWNDFTPETG